MKQQVNISKSWLLLTMSVTDLVTSSAYTRVEQRSWPRHTCSDCMAAERHTLLPQGGEGHQRELPPPVTLSSCSTHFEVCLAVDVLGGQLAANEKVSILILDNNWKNPPYIVSFWVFWGCCLVCQLLRHALSRGDSCVRPASHTLLWI